MGKVLYLSEPMATDWEAVETILVIARRGGKPMAHSKVETRATTIQFARKKDRDEALEWALRYAAARQVPTTGIIAN